MAKKQKKIKVGVVGVGRGKSFMRGAEPAGLELVAICDTWKEKVKEVSKEQGVTAYTDYDKFLEHKMDAVVLANYFHEHAPFAIKALEKGLHVMSECAACATLAEGVKLIEAVEKSGKTYMFAENYPYMASNQEMRRLYKEGEIGKFLYGECEYVHPDPPEVKMGRSVGWDHWRNLIPATYYCTHSIAPIMYITDTWPVKVNGFVIPFDFDDYSFNMTCRKSDTAASLMIQMDNGAIMKSLHGGLRGHANWTRIHGNKGLMERGRGAHAGWLRLHKAPFDKGDTEPYESFYVPEFPEHNKEALKTGHGGGDFFTNFHFANAIRSGKQPYLNVYRGVAMSIVGIQAYRSALDNNACYEIPDFRKKSTRNKYRNDNWNPYPDMPCENKPASSVLGEIQPSKKAKAFCRKIWKKKGWNE
ncbi:MAG: Gfo/Idh/MocA family protein [Planctomycetota bacterium]|jgi:predicted dehydrogenase